MLQQLNFSFKDQDYFDTTQIYSLLTESESPCGALRYTVETLDVEGVSLLEDGTLAISEESVIPDTAAGEDAALLTIQFNIEFAEEDLSEAPTFENPYSAEIMLGHCEYTVKFNETPGLFGGQDNKPIILMKEMELTFRIKQGKLEDLFEFGEGGLCGGIKNASLEIHDTPLAYLEEERTEAIIPGLYRVQNKAWNRELDKDEAVTG